jgi:hypothetical protein
MHQDTRGVSTVLGIALLFAVVVGGMVVVVTVGATAIDDTERGLDTKRAETTLTQFDSRSAMVALGGTSNQGVDLAAGSSEGYGVDPEAGWMNVTVYNATSEERTTLVNVTMGSVAYENRDDAIAYQGGGVWQRTEAGTKMLSPPEFHFRDQTLTLPIITVDGDRSLGGNARVTRAKRSAVRYPNASADSNFTNPLDDGYVNVTVNSEYYEAWGGYFEQRTDGDVFYDHENETALIQLVVPFEEDFTNVVATTNDGGITVNGIDPQPSPSETGVNYPLADTRIEDAVEECETDSTACDDTTAFSSITDGGTYYRDSSFSGNVDVDTSNGNVTLVVDGDFDPSSVAISGDNFTEVLVRGDVVGDNAQHTKDADAFRVIVHSDGEFDMNGNTEFDGFLYAPGSTCDMNGNAFIVGGAVCETMDINGNPNDFTYDPAVEDINLFLDEDSVKVTYLHVTENPINVTSG